MMMTSHILAFPIAWDACTVKKKPTKPSDKVLLRHGWVIWLWLKDIKFTEVSNKSGFLGHLIYLIFVVMFIT